MTNQEAIETIKANYPPENYSMLREALDMAIELLKKHRKPDCEHAEHDGIGCLGYSGCAQDDEPIEVCKECEKYTGNIFETLQDGKVE